MEQVANIQPLLSTPRFLFQHRLESKKNTRLAIKQNFSICKKQSQTCVSFLVPSFIILRIQYHLSSELKYPVRENFNLADILQLLSNTDQCPRQNHLFSKVSKKNICAVQQNSISVCFHQLMFATTTRTDGEILPKPQKVLFNI